MRRIIANGSVEMVGLAGSQALEPDLPRKLLQGSTERAMHGRWHSVSCSRCRPQGTGPGLDRCGARGSGAVAISGQAVVWAR